MVMMGLGSLVKVDFCSVYYVDYAHYYYYYYHHQC